MRLKKLGKIVIGILILHFPSITPTTVKNKRQKDPTLLTEMRQNLQIELKDLDFNIKGVHEYKPTRSS
ncbi:MAG: hypothetical protein IPG21_17610 [Saprospiraceae bacterium]|nr:hypothetical protein [Candidatus Vicinibacter affinis]